MAEIDYTDLLQSQYMYSEEKVVNDVQSLVDLLLKMQQWEIDKVSSSPIIEESLIEHINKHYINVPLQRKGVDFNEDFGMYVLNELQDNRSNLVFCVGDSGSGKSTLLVKTFLDLSLSNEPVLPIYMNLNNASSITLNREQILSNICFRYKIHTEEAIINALFGSYRLVFLLDGLDEKNPYLTNKAIEQEVSQRTDDTYIISCRTHLFQQLNISDIDSRFELRPMDADRRIRYFNDMFSDAPKYNAETIKQIISILSDSEHDKNPFSNILLLTLLAGHLKAEPDFLLNLDKRRGTIINSIISATIEREIRKNKLDISFRDAVAIIETTAKFTYDRQYNRQSFNYDMMVKRVRRAFSTIESTTIDKAIHIFIARIDITGTYRFIHSQLYDFFVARAMFMAMKEKKGIEECFKYNLSIDINAILSDLMRDDEPQVLFNTLKRICSNHIRKLLRPEYVVLSADYCKLHLLMMHMQRTGEYDSVYCFASKQIGLYKSLPPYVEVLLLHSKVAGGFREEDEDVFFRKLVSDKGFRDRHIGMTLLYYNSDEEFRLPYLDDGEIGYKGVLSAYLRHFAKHNTIKHYYIARRHNTFVMKCLLEKRKTIPREVATSCDSIKQFVENDSSVFGKKVKKEYASLIRTIKKYPITETDF